MMRRHPTSGGPLRPRRWRRVVLAAALVVLASSPTFARTAATAAPTAARLAPAPATDALRLDLLDQDLAFRADGAIRLTYRLSGDLAGIAGIDVGGTAPTTTIPPTTTEGAASEGESGSEVQAPPPTPLTVWVSNYAPVDDGDDLERFVGPSPDPADYGPAIDGVQIEGVRELLEVHDDGTATLSLTIATDVVESQPERLKFEEPGLYPLRVLLLVGDVAAPSARSEAATLAQRLPDPVAGQPVSEAVHVAAVTAIDDPGPVADDAERELAASQLDELAVAAAATAVPLTMAVPPSVLDEATTTATEQEVLADAFVDDELLALPAVPFDVSSAAAVDHVDAFTAELVRGEDALAADLPTTPVRRDVWLVTEPLSGAGAQALRERGVRLLVITEDVYRSTVDEDLPRTDLFVDVGLPDGTTMPMIVVDDLGATMTTTAADIVLDRMTATEWAVATVGALIADGADGELREQRSIILADPTLGPLDPRLLDALAATADTTPGIRVARATELNGITDTQLVGATPLTVTLPEVAGPELGPRLEQLEATAATAFNAASMLPEGDPRPPEWAAELELLTSPAYPDEHVDAAVDSILQETAEITGSIVPPEPFTFTLTGREGDIDMRIGNTADEPLTVKLRLSSPKLTFPQGEQLITLRPDDETSIIVPVRARSNGTSSVEVEILTPVDQPLIEPVTLTSRVTSLTGLGQVLTGGLVLVLLSWWFSHWRRDRRRRLENGDPTPLRGLRRRRARAAPAGDGPPAE
jgi:hypothetical protein